MTVGLADFFASALLADADAPAAAAQTSMGTVLVRNLLRRSDDWHARLRGLGITRGSTFGWLGFNGPEHEAVHAPAIPGA